jgi:polyphosphate glucokinase
MKNTSPAAKILSIDIGGSHIKATILNREGELQMDYEKIATPMPSTPKNLIAATKELVRNFPKYDYISSGFPGYVKNGVVKTAPNLGNDAWKNFDLAEGFTKELGAPAKVVNDADMQGLGVVDGKGFEMVITLGTGFGTAFLLDGHLLPHLEISHLPIKKGDYDDYIGERALEKEGKEKWNKRIEKVFEILKTVFNYDTLYIGGGNGRKITFKLDDNMKLVTNEDGIKGGARLWTMDDLPETAVPKAKTAKK